jgi:hypothetical protein
MGKLIGVALGGFVGLPLLVGAAVTWIRRRRAYQKKRQQLRDGLLLSPSLVSMGGSVFPLGGDGVEMRATFLSGGPELPTHNRTISSSLVPTPFTLDAGDTSSQRPRKSPRLLPPSGSQGIRQVEREGVPPALALNGPALAHLTQAQLDLLQRLSEQHVPSQVLASVAESLVNPLVGVPGEGPLEAGPSNAGPPSEDAPPRYDK